MINIINNLDNIKPLEKKNKKELIDIYQIPISEEEVNLEASLNNVFDIYLDLEFFKNEILLISYKTNINNRNIRYRLIQLINELRNNAPFPEISEENLKYILEYSGLKFTFNKISPRLIITSLLHLIIELFDLNYLNINQLKYFDRIFRINDPKLSLFDPLERPNTIKKSYIEEKDPIYNSDSYEKWHKIEEKDFLKIQIKSEDNYILAEQSILIFTDRERITEIRNSKFIFDKTNIPDNMNSFYHRILPTSIEEYPNLKTEDKCTDLILENMMIHSMTNNSNWLAFNPMIGNDLGWKLSETGMFRWVDDTGNMMVETIWWQDGLKNSYNLTHDEVGEGWLVIASKEAIKKIIDKFGNISQIKGIKRYKEYEYSDYNSKIKKEALIYQNGKLYNTDYGSNDIQDQNLKKYIGNIQTSVFHSPECRHVKKIIKSNVVKFNSKNDAIKEKYRPCKLCFKKFK